ncbi:MAG: hypothetical protein IPK82_30480 [Polyangiaceae bacterium]|nr:hypothetical protein [Polyangiaceae bacterium]
MTLRTTLQTSGLATLLSVAACANVLGTSDYKPCEVESCSEGGGGAGASSTGTSTTSSTGTGTSTEPCFNVTVNVSGSVKVKLETTEIDFEQGLPGPHCLPAGSTTFFAECDSGGGSDPPVAVAWGNPLCPDQTTSCTFDLQKDETFTVSSGDCP